MEPEWINIQNANANGVQKLIVFKFYFSVKNIEQVNSLDFFREYRLYIFVSLIHSGKQGTIFKYNFNHKLQF